MSGFNGLLEGWRYREEPDGATPLWQDVGDDRDCEHCGGEGLVEDGARKPQVCEVCEAVGKVCEGYRLCAIDSHEAPASLEERCRLYYGAPDESMAYVHAFDSVSAMLAWLETAEYVLPENGDGPKANGWELVIYEQDVDGAEVES